MKNTFVLLVLLISVSFAANGQSRFQVAVTGGLAFTPDTKFRNCTGHIGNSLTNSLSLLYRIDSSFGLELKFSGLGYPTSYLENEGDNTLRVYTTSKINPGRVLAGCNYYIPLKGIHPFAGVVAGVSHHLATVAFFYPASFNFTAGFQAGAAVKLTPSIALRLDACAVWIPGVSNNSPYFGVGQSSAFPFFILGDPSNATIRQYDVNLGILFSFRHSKK